MKILVITVFVILAISLKSCGQEKIDKQIVNHKQSKAIEYVNLKSINYVVLEYDTSYHWYFPEKVTQSKITEMEVKQCEALINAYIIEYNKKAIKQYESLKKKYPAGLRKLDFAIEIKEYYRQYIPAEAANRRLVLVNAFCEGDSHEYWKTGLVEVMDGGNCYIKFLIDLEKKKIIRFSENGIA